MTTSTTKAPSLLKLGASLFYEALVLIALLFVGTGLFVLIAGDAMVGFKRTILQCWIVGLISFYFIVSWVRNGQTLALRSWGLKLVMATEQQTVPVLLPRSVAIIRLVLAALSLACFGLGFLWCLFDGEHRFLHDRLLKTKIIDIKP